MLRFFTVSRLALNTNLIFETGFNRINVKAEDSRIKKGAFE
jgi:hypothetical protein